MFLSVCFLSCLIRAVSLFLTRKVQMTKRVMNRFTSTREPSEKNSAPSAYTVGEKSSVTPFSCIPHMNDIRKRAARETIATEYTLRVLCPARNMTMATARRMIATHLSIELSKKGVALVLS